MLLLVGMACATVYESMHTPERALAVFYRSWWFRALLGSVAVNVLASMVVRYPFSKRQIGFVLTHSGILVTLAGALVTCSLCEEGQLGLFEGDTVEEYSSAASTLTVVNRGEGTRSSIDLVGRSFGGYERVDQPTASVLKLDEASFHVERYLPDAEWVEQVLDDHADPQPAIEVAWSAPDAASVIWVFAGETKALDSAQVTFQMIEDADALISFLDTAPRPQPDAQARVIAKYAGEVHTLSLADLLKGDVTLRGTEFAVRALRFLPHAIVGSDHQVTNASDQPINPAVELEVVTPRGREKRLIFANFPVFRSMHAEEVNEDLELTFEAPSVVAHDVPIEVVSGPAEGLHVRFNPQDGDPITRALPIGIAVDTPWPGETLTVRRRLEHARRQWSMDAVEPVRKARKPVLLLGVSAAPHSDQMWVQRLSPRSMTINGVPYEVVFAGKRNPLGFALTLDRFQVGFYPGSTRPRSFESHVTITDPASGRTLSRVVSMNHPVKYGRFTVYQSSYRKGPQQTASFLSVSWDPGQPVVFAGYIIMLIGMVVVLGIRLADRAVGKM
ncbi:MAG: cytochrome c biogenesis protein ResB [bacterium]|nr:cytochrome c biogenesis protein ResB [bacterium]